MRTLQPSSRKLLLGHLVLNLLLGAALIAVGRLDSLLILLIAPVVYGAYSAPDRVYLPMLVASSTVSAVVVWFVSGNLTSSLINLCLLTVALVVVGETIHRQNAARARAERDSRVFVALGQELNQVATSREAAQVIVGAADRLLGWDACALELYWPEEGRAEAVLIIDTVGGERRDFDTSGCDATPSPMMSSVIARGAMLINRAPGELPAETLGFGDHARPSASLMYVPIRTGAKVIGAISIQSYTTNAYRLRDLETLQALADYCGGRLGRLRAELAVREQEARYRAITELTSDFIFAATLLPDGAQRTEWLTEGAFERLTGFAAAEFTARGDWDALVHPDDAPLSRRRAQRLLAGQSDVSELRIVTRAGETRWLRAYSRPTAAAAAGQPASILGAMQDITARKQAEDTLLHRQKLESLGVLAGGIAHDFNNLLTVIIGNAELALLDAPPGGPGAEALGQLARAAQRAAELTQQMLAYSGRGRFALGPVRLNELVADMLVLLGASLPKQIQLVARAQPELPALEGDASQLNQLILNLVVNAAEAIGDVPGTITVATAARRVDPAALVGWQRPDDMAGGLYVGLEVADTGAGIAPANLARVFDPFFSTKFTGRGLGLAVVTGVVRSHGGALQVSSELGRGTVFRVLLPASTQALAHEPPEPPAPALVRGALAGRTVLIIDDEESVRGLAARILERAGARVLQAPDGYAALVALSDGRVGLDCVLLDLTMPGLSGEQVLAEIGPLRPGLPVVLMSGYDAHELQGRLGEAAVAAFLQKPFQPHALQEAIRGALGL